MASTDARPIPIKNTAFRAVFPILDADGDLARLRVTHGQRLVATAPISRTPDWAALACLADIAGPV
jgi:hypothetical protein